MDSSLLHPPSHVLNAAFFAVGIAIATLVGVVVIRRPSLDVIPIAGSSGWISSWRAGFKFPENGLNVIREGYAKYKRRPFKVADRHRWLVILSSREHLDELRRATKDVFSFDEAIRIRMAGDYTMGKHNLTNSYHIPFVHSQLTRNIGTLCPEIREEIVAAFDDILGIKCDEWKSVLALNTIQKIVFRTSNRFIVGLPLCRDSDWMDFSIQNAVDIFNGCNFLLRFPAFLEPFLSLFIPNSNQANKRAMKFLAPVIAERQRFLGEHGPEWADKPNDFLSWLMDIAEGKERTPERLTSRVIFLIFGSFHSTAQSFAHALVYLAANPQYIQPLREEVDTAIKQEGWSKAALEKMPNVDSFLKESQRLKGAGSESLARVAMADFTFSDGTFIPKGTLVSAPSGCLHLDDDLYENASVFDPFRFAKMRGESEGAKHQFVSTSLDYLAFGHGKHACPGRFFAASQMKTMLAHIVMAYDVKLGTPPKDIQMSTMISVDPTVEVMFKQRN